MVTPIVVSSVKSKGKVIVFGDMNTHARMLQHEVLSFNDANHMKNILRNPIGKHVRAILVTLTPMNLCG